MNYFKFAVINWLHYKQKGTNPFFVNTCDKDISAQEIHDRFEELEGKDVCIAGRIMSWRRYWEKQVLWISTTVQDECMDIFENR